MSEPPVTPELLLQAYTAGYFPMARNGRGRSLYWFNPDTRGVLPLDEMGAFHLPRSLKKFIRRGDYTITVDTAFPDVIQACADSRREGREDTWINKDIIRLYTELHEMGHAHSIEVWANSPAIPAQAGIHIPESVVMDSRLRGNGEKKDTWSGQEARSVDRASPERGEAVRPCERQDVAQRGKRISGQQAASALSQRSDIHLSASRREGDKTNTDQRTLVGGLYGVSLGGAFFGESMFSTRANASKCALVHLVRRLQAAGYTLLDAQFENAHLTQFGFRAMSREDYLLRLRKALSISPSPSSRFLTVSVSKF